jgi:UDPglucose 6-dehydrogenase
MQPVDRGPAQLGAGEVPTDRLISRLGTPMKLVIAGGGYVGLATAVGFGRHGHDIELIEIDAERAARLNRGQLPFDEPSLAEDLAGLIGSRLRVHHGYPSAIADVDFAFVCVDTHPAEGGYLDGSRVVSAANSLIDVCGSDVALVLRSTVNPGTATMIHEQRASREAAGPVLMNPEFLREGSALSDFDNPARRVIGGDDAAAIERLAQLYSYSDRPVLRTDATTAEVIKMAANAALAVRVSMANEIAHIAEASGANPETVLAAVGGDPRIGPDFLQAGIGFGGSCLPKDLAALRATAQRFNVSAPVFGGTEATNALAIERLVERCRELTDGHQLNGAASQRSVCVVGLGFKPGSDSIRSSQSIRLVRALLDEGFDVGVVDPIAEENARVELADTVTYVASLDDALPHYDVVVAVFPSPEHDGLESPRAQLLDSLGRRIAGPTQAIPSIAAARVSKMEASASRG